MLSNGNLGFTQVHKGLGTNHSSSCNIPRHEMIQEVLDIGCSIILFPKIKKCLQRISVVTKMYCKYESYGLGSKLGVPCNPSNKHATKWNRRLSVLSREYTYVWWRRGGGVELTSHKSKLMMGCTRRKSPLRGHTRAKSLDKKRGKRDIQYDSRQLDW